MIQRFINFAIIREMTDAIDGRLNTLSIKDGTIWEGLTTTPTGIAVFGQLMISTSRVTDFQIDKIKKEAISLIKQPDSFRRTLMQIADEVYGAFTKAHTNMEMIQSQVAQVPGYVMDCVKIIQSGNKTAINQDLPRRLGNIKKIADNGLRMSTEVAQAFERLGNLNRQVFFCDCGQPGSKREGDWSCNQSQNLSRNGKSTKGQQPRARKCAKSTRNCTGRRATMSTAIG
jgi:hypothetical protein